jgi:hypothetical protein
MALEPHDSPHMLLVELFILTLLILNYHVVHDIICTHDFPHLFGS